MSTFTQGSGLIVEAPRNVEQAAHEERWPAPVATLFITTTSLALWAGIFAFVDLLIG